MGKPGIYLSDRQGWASCYRDDPVLGKYVQIANQYDLSAQLLAGSRALILTLGQDQYLLMRNRDLLDGYVRDGGTIVFQGQVALPFLACLSPYVPAENLKYDEFDVRLERSHPILRGIDPVSLNLRHGVRGFYSHGSNPPPADAIIVSTIRHGSVVVDWEWHNGKGRVFVHSGNDFCVTFEDGDKDVHLTRAMVAWAIREDLGNV